MSKQSSKVDAEGLKIIKENSEKFDEFKSQTSLSRQSNRGSRGSSFGGSRENSLSLSSK